MFRHVKDKFGNSLLLQRTTPSLLREELKHGEIKRLRFVGDPEEEECDSVNRRFLDRFYVKREDYDKLVSRLSELENTNTQSKQKLEELHLEIATVKDSNESLKTSCLQYIEDPCCWNAKHKKISLVSDGEAADDVSTMRQTLTYDEEKDVFKCGSREFKLVTNNPDRPLIQANRDRFSGFSIYGTDKEYRPNTFVYWTKGVQTTGMGSKFIWDAKSKTITPFYDGKQNHHSHAKDTLFIESDFSSAPHF